MTRTRPATVRVYFDADVLGLAQVLCRVRPDFTYPGDPGATIHKLDRPPCPITDPGAKDPDWIATVATLGWLIVTRDARIQEKPAEIAAVRDNTARMINLSSRDAGTVWTQLEVFMGRWRAIEPLIEQPGPFIYTATRTGPLRSIDLGR